MTENNKKYVTKTVSDGFAEKVLQAVDPLTFQRMCSGLFTSIEIPTASSIEEAAKLLDEKFSTYDESVTDIRFPKNSGTVYSNQPYTPSVAEQIKNQIDQMAEEVNQEIQDLMGSSIPTTETPHPSDFVNSMFSEEEIQHQIELNNICMQQQAELSAQQAELSAQQAQQQADLINEVNELREKLQALLDEKQKMEEPPVETKPVETTDAEQEDHSFASAIYDEIAGVIGGTNENQFLSLQIPGTILYADDYKYDVETNAPKPPVVEANESRLANKLFDPCRITGGDNGFSLPYQYESSLDILSPKLNKNVSDFKNKLRQLLLNEYPYDFGDGVEKNYTMQEVYFRLYNEYLESITTWNQIQNDEKKRLREEYSDNTEFNNAYLKWYETEVVKYTNETDQKLAKILSVFSPNDMKILEGVLDSGSGAELQEARQNLKRVRKLTPTGGYIYPVRFVPADWFRKIGSSFTPTDLMKTPEYLIADLQDTALRRSQLCSYIENMGLLRKDDDIVAAYTKTKNLSQLLEKQTETILGKLQAVVQDMDVLDFSNTKVLELSELRKILVPIEDIQANLGKESRKLIVEKLASRESAGAITPLTALVKFSYREIGEITRATSLKVSYIGAVKELKVLLNKYAHPKADAEGKYEFEPDTGLAERLDPVATQFDETNARIEKLIQELNFAAGLITTANEVLVSKTAVPSGFTQINIEREMKTIIEESSSYATSKGVITGGLGFLFHGRSSKYKSSATAEITKMFEDCTINISMNITKIGIERDWFNPGIFGLTKDMIKMGSLIIAPQKTYDGITDERLTDMKDCLFPCYPVALVLARDMTISFNFKSAKNISEQYKFIEKQATSGSGFLLFSNMAGNTTMQQSRSHVSIQNNTITVRNDATQLIGHYLEATRPDESTPFENVIRHRREGNMSNIASISEFAGDYKTIINDSVTRRRKWRLEKAVDETSEAETTPQ